MSLMLQKTPELQQSRLQNSIVPWLRLALFFCLMLYFLMRSIDYIYLAGCAQSLGAGTTIESGDLGLVSAGYQWLVMLLGAAIVATWPGVSKWRGLWRAFLFIVTSFCLSIVLSVWYESHVAETCVRPGAAMLESGTADFKINRLANAPPTRI